MWFALWDEIFKTTPFSHTHTRTHALIHTVLGVLGQVPLWQKAELCVQPARLPRVQHIWSLSQCSVLWKGYKTRHISSHNIKTLKTNFFCFPPRVSVRLAVLCGFVKAWLLTSLPLWGFFFFRFFLSGQEVCRFCLLFNPIGASPGIEPATR